VPSFNISLFLAELLLSRGVSSFRCQGNRVSNDLSMCWELIRSMVNEEQASDTGEFKSNKKVQPRQYARDYNADTSPLKQSLITGARRFLSNEFYEFLKVQISSSSNKEYAQRSGLPSVILFFRLFAAQYVQCFFCRPSFLFFSGQPGAIHDIRSYLNVLSKRSSSSTPWPSNLELVSFFAFFSQFFCSCINPLFLLVFLRTWTSTLCGPNSIICSAPVSLKMFSNSLQRFIPCIFPPFPDSLGFFLSLFQYESKFPTFVACLKDRFSSGFSSFSSS
jgi:hypothetical protein